MASSAVAPAHVLRRLKDDGTFDYLRHKILAELKQNEELKQYTTALVEKTLASADLASKTRRELFVSLRQQLEPPVLEKASTAAWELIISSEGVGAEIKSKVEEIYALLETQEKPPPDQSPIKSVPIPTGASVPPVQTRTNEFFQEGTWPGGFPMGGPSSIPVGSNSVMPLQRDPMEQYQPTGPVNVPYRQTETNGFHGSFGPPDMPLSIPYLGSDPWQSQSLSRGGQVPEATLQGPQLQGLPLGPGPGQTGSGVGPNTNQPMPQNVGGMEGGGNMGPLGYGPDPRAPPSVLTGPNWQEWRGEMNHMGPQFNQVPQQGFTAGPYMDQQGPASNPPFPPPSFPSHTNSSFPHRHFPHHGGNNSEYFAQGSDADPGHRGEGRSMRGRGTGRNWGGRSRGNWDRGGGRGRDWGGRGRGGRGPRNWQNYGQNHGQNQNHGPPYGPNGPNGPIHGSSYGQSLGESYGQGHVRSHGQNYGPSHVQSHEQNHEQGHGQIYGKDQWHGKRDGDNPSDGPPSNHAKFQGPPRPDDRGSSRWDR